MRVALVVDNSAPASVIAAVTDGANTAQPPLEKSAVARLAAKQLDCLTQHHVGVTGEALRAACASALRIVARGGCALVYFRGACRCAKEGGVPSLLGVDGAAVELDWIVSQLPPHSRLVMVLDSVRQHDEASKCEGWALWVLLLTVKLTMLTHHAPYRCMRCGQPR